MIQGRVLVLICVLILAVSASVSETIRQIPLMEVGSLWVKAVETLASRLLTAVTTVPDMTDPLTYAKLAVLAGVLYGVWAVFFRPLNRVRKLGDIGYIPEGAYSTKETASMVQKRRKVGKIPPPYPNGWFGIMESFLLKKGEAKTVSMLGQNLAVFRDETGTAHVLDAYCPHMGANLAVGGRVLDGCIECPFHAWRFRGVDGKCVSIPYTEKIPDVARVKSWPVCERSGWIFMWHHAEGADPTWEIPRLEEVDSGAWVYRGRTEHHINAHIEEIPENGADVVHLGHVHGPIMTAGVNLHNMWDKWWSFAKHHWTANWQQCPEPDGHVGALKLTHNISVFGITIPMMNLQVSARQIGPALVYLEFKSFFGSGVFIQTVTPLEPLLQKVVHNIYVTSWMPTCIAKFYMVGEAIQVERDVMIWNNKQYEARPMFVKSKEDSLIAKHRRWYSQFYPAKEKNESIFQKDTLEF
ncbi:cholesterol 7-desaturase [Aplysia californica]|uniref:cholesterol 7-desaturase n=1 Tax=Aplysia californica TaxID=6500 RepID=A0ABM1A239_APLCA|nr:cholesterol 7-desaturase [Aplysia californica]